MSGEARRDVFQAIADPTRREILNLLAQRRLTVNRIAENFDMSRPAISQHVKFLIECGLIVVEQEGRERYCEAKLQKLNEVAAWVDRYRQFWNTKLDALEMFLETTNKKPKNQKNEKSPRKSQQRKGRI